MRLDHRPRRTSDYLFSNAGQGRATSRGEVWSELTRANGIPRGKRAALPVALRVYVSRVCPLRNAVRKGRAAGLRLRRCQPALREADGVEGRRRQKSYRSYSRDMGV